MRRALIGSTGFVGSNLATQTRFSDLFNSKNSTEMVGQVFDTIVCSGVSAVKWLANKDPETDLRRIEELQTSLRSVKASLFILVSTVDVYPDTQGVDEEYDCSLKPTHPYGAHRLAFEQFCRDTFPECYIVRLPALFGEGLKKNVIFDLLNDNVCTV